MVGRTDMGDCYGPGQVNPGSKIYDNQECLMTAEPLEYKPIEIQLK